MSYFGGFAFSSTLRAQARPNASTLAQTAGGRYMARRSSFSSSGFDGRPRFFGSFMRAIVVPHKIVADSYFRCHNKSMNTLMHLRAAVQSARTRTGDQHIGTQVSKGGVDVVRAVPPATGRGKHEVTVLRAGLTPEQAVDFLDAMQ